MDSTAVAITDQGVKKFMQYLEAKPDQPDEKEVGRGKEARAPGMEGLPVRKKSGQGKDSGNEPEQAEHRAGQGPEPGADFFQQRIRIAKRYLKRHQVHFVKCLHRLHPAVLSKQGIKHFRAVGL